VVAVVLPALAAWRLIPASSPFDPDRLMADIRTYQSFGVHRTASSGDRRTSEWLSDRFREAGLETSHHTWTLRQFSVEKASIEDARGLVPAFPVWLPKATGAAGVRGRLVRLDANTPLAELAGAVAWIPSAGTPGGLSREAWEKRAVDNGAVAMVVATSDTAGTGHLAAENAVRRYVGIERPVPTLVFGKADAPRLGESLGRNVTVHLDGHMDEAATAVNVLGRLVRHAEADWLIVSTPSSGWFACGGERGPGIAILLALVEWASRRGGRLNYLFVATSGHELDQLGARVLHEARLAPPPEKTRAWLHLGASLATPRWHDVDGVLRRGDRVTSGMLQATPDLAPVLQRAFVELPMFTMRTDTRIGEYRDLVENGYRGLGVLGGDNPWLHVERDDPGTVLAPTLSAVARATAAALAVLDP